MGLLDRVRNHLAEQRAARDAMREQRAAYVTALEQPSKSDANARTLVATLPPPADLPPWELKRRNDGAFRELAERYLADDILTEQEEHDLLDVGERLGVSGD